MMSEKLPKYIINLKRILNLRNTQNQHSLLFFKLKQQKIQNQLSCGGCFACIDKITDFAKIGTKQVGFCSEECYGDWLLNPTAQNLPIDANLLKSYLRDNPQ